MPKGYEAQLAITFGLRVRSITSAVPDEDDYVGWLVLMQHHGMPTRLLDWSESALIGLYFAVTGQEAEDGELWVMQPAALNSVSCDTNVIVAGHHPGVKKLALQARSLEGFWESRHVTSSECPTGPISIFPDLKFDRQTNQCSAFTIHPIPNNSNGIEQLVEHPLLARYVIPAAHKGGIRDSLASLGLSHRTLFPDVDGLCKSLILDEERRGRTGTIEPDPPRCGGEID
jgi:hypothetical protein